jgi:hypothetical protein
MLSWAYQEDHKAFSQLSQGVIVQFARVVHYQSVTEAKLNNQPEE